MLRRTAVGAVLMLLAGCATQTAQAAPQSTPAATTTAADTGCTAAPTPNPAHLAGEATIRWGWSVACTSPTALAYTIRLYRVTGAGSHLYRDEMSAHAEGASGTTLADTWPYPCHAAAPSFWQSTIVGTVNGLPMVFPTGAFGPVVELPCA